jgi:hypothetical protein
MTASAWRRQIGPLSPAMPDTMSSSLVLVPLPGIAAAASSF